MNAGRKTANRFNDCRSDSSPADVLGGKISIDNPNCVRP
jgi:hypothetical protein